MHLGQDHPIVVRNNRYSSPRDLYMITLIMHSGAMTAGATNQTLKKKLSVPVSNLMCVRAQLLKTELYDGPAYSI